MDVVTDGHGKEMEQEVVVSAEPDPLARGPPTENSQDKQIIWAAAFNEETETIRKEVGIFLSLGLYLA